MTGIVTSDKRVMDYHAVKTLDRYIFRRFVYIFAIFLVTLYGLFIVIDLFTNVDAFQEEATGTADAVRRICMYYVIRFTEFFEMTGPILAIISVIVVLATIQRSSELKPVLAAGIPTYRMVVPLLLGVLCVNVTLFLNQEFLIPAVSQRLQTPRGKGQHDGQAVEPLYDYDQDGLAVLHIDGDRINLSSRTLTDPSFTIRPPRLAHRLISFKGSEAIFYPATSSRSQSGWLLKGIESVDLDSLTEAGRKTIVPQRNSTDEVFIVSDVSFDQLYNRTRNHSMVSAAQLARRIRMPSTGMAPVRGQQLHLHFRFTRPLLAFAMVFACVPLVLRRESRSLIGNMGICSVVMATMYGVGQACLYLGGTSLLETDLAAWLPVMICGGAAAFMSGGVQT